MQLYDEDQFLLSHLCDCSCIDTAERLALEKQRLNQRLGLDIAAQMGISGNDQLIKDEDLIQQQTSGPVIQQVYNNSSQ